ncbi:hypothetical protein [Anaplasma phagocytophilum]|nr:hypothetical protein [Anaplasma phagocytophilum]
MVRLTLANKSGWRQAVYPYLKDGKSVKLESHGMTVAQPPR